MTTETKLLVLTDEQQDEIQAGKRIATKKELRETLAKQINETYAEYTGMTGDVLNLALRVENGRIRLGTLLKEAKDDVKHGNFMKWLEENCPAISHQTCWRAMQFAKKAGYREITSFGRLQRISQGFGSSGAERRT